MTLTNKINGIHRDGDNIYTSSKAYCIGGQTYPVAWASSGLTIPHFNYIFQRDVNGPYYQMDYQLANNTRPRFDDYENFTFIVDGESKRAYVGNEGYEWGIDAPSNGPALAEGTGSLTGTYQCYVTFYVGFPNDKWVETGPSPMKEIVVSATHSITWSGISTCNFVGDYLKIYRRLYRAISGVIYLVATIPDNFTTTYSDNVLDATLQGNSIMGTDDYIPPPTQPIDMEVYLQRIFVIKENKLYWSEPYSPFSFTQTGNVVVTKKESEDLTGIISWGDQIYVVSAEEWYRLQGSDPTTWNIKRTFSDAVIINTHTLIKTKYGLVGLWNDGIYIFDGNISKNITDKILSKKFFTDLYDLSVSYAVFDGIRYWFYYASSGSVVNSCFILDFTYYPDCRVHHDNFVADAHEFYKPTNIHYFAKNGYEYTNGGTEVIATNLVTGDKGFGNIVKRKCLDYLYYDINTNGQNVTVQILVDGVSVQTLTLNSSTRIRKRSDKLKAIEGYRFGLQLDCANSQYVYVYAPWTLEATPVGE